MHYLPMNSRFGSLHFPIEALLLLIWCLASVSSARAAEEKLENQGNPPGSSEPYLSPTNGLGSWIWAEKTFDGQKCRLWKTFEIPPSATVLHARLAITADNEFTVYLEGRELGRGAEWRELFIFDLAWLLTPGKHVLAVEAFNSFSAAGVLLGLRVDLADGNAIVVQSDETWKVVPNSLTRWEKRTEAQNTWPAASIKASLGAGPWWRQPVNVNVMPVLRPIRTYFWQRGWFQILLVSVCALVILVSFRLAALLALHRKERRLLQQERARIAREIHDDIGSRITQLVLHGEVAQGGLSDTSELKQQLVQICDDARGLLSSMDEVLWAVNPRRDTLRDFASFVCKYAQEFLKATPIQCVLEVDPEMAAAVLDLPLRRSLLMAIKEALNNAVKYSEATELRLQIQWQAQRLVVVVLDNGKGFDLAEVDVDRNGLTNMAQRMSELEGFCRVTSSPGKGSRVEFSIPLKRSPRHTWAWGTNEKPFTGPANGSRKAPGIETT
jgi:signal transduction histidine kinase